ncbi:calcium permeable stress-gated cation channel 1-like isoform X2 [Dreissena polymorpha]|uniref:calcium permeable stress-gated cation channel 1-like isoform X2 n=1 Tax=Dreissena polymorpha TaxID=45954 RepID=UPI00226430BA|nr:calcium permeable stress-gated cation channel 1-like isoform X2 [Dreissena polymorpha]
MFHLKPLTEPSGISMEELIDETVTVDPELFKVFGEQQDIHVCSETLVYQNKTSIGFLYGGIPETLVINICVWLLLILLFAILRRVAWDYGKIALVTRQEKNTLREPQTVNEYGVQENKYNVWTSLFYGDQDGVCDVGSVESFDSQIFNQDRGICSWIMAFIRVKDSNIAKKCGYDAVQYLQFQRYILLYVLIVCILSTAIIIPVNFTGSNQGNATDLGHTTIANLDSNSNLLWVHVFLCLFYLGLAIGFMRHFSVNLRFEDDEMVSKTLMIANIPKEKCFKNLIVQHFHEGYPEVSVRDVTFAYNIEKLMGLNAKRMSALESRLNSEQELQKTGHRPTLSPYCCGQLLCCGETCGCREVDAITYYGDEETSLEAEIEKEKVIAYQNNLGVAFVTFENVGMAERILHDFQPSCKASQNPQPSSIHLELDVVQWDVSYAPAPENIYWDKLTQYGWRLWVKTVLINFLVIILLFFFTTPAIVLNNLDKLNYKEYIEKTGSAVLIQFLPTLLLWTFTALLPSVVAFADMFVGHWTRSSEHHAVMQKTFVFLLLMILILPSLGLTSASALFNFFLKDHGKNINWGCIFLSGNGAFFINYVITSAFIGTALELLRFSELFMYGLKILTARSSAERTSVRKHVIWEFQYGVQYAWFLSLFAIIMSYSVSCPLITPFGLVYMVFKHLVDRYNLYFAYKPSKISPNIHSTAVNYVIIAVIFLQFNFVFFSVIRGSTDQPISIFSDAILFIILVVFFGKVCFGCFQSITPFNPNRYQQLGEQTGLSNKREDSNQQFVASVLTEPQGTSVVQSASSTLAQSYGTMTTTQPTRQTDGDT